MKEFTIEVAQSLIDETLDCLSFNPFTIIDWRPGKVNDEGSPDGGVIDNPRDTMLNYLNSTLNMVSENSDPLTKNCYFKLINACDNKKLDNLLKLRESGKIKSEQKMQLSLLLRAREANDALQLASVTTAQYVLAYKDQFKDKTVIDQAQKIINNPNGGISTESIGDFFKKVISVVSNLVKTVGHWVRGIASISIGSPRVTHLVLHQWGRPQIIVGNPLEVNKIDIKVHVLDVEIPYTVQLFGWHYNGAIKFSVDDTIEVKADGDYTLSYDKSNMKVSVAAHFSYFNFSITILGIRFSITITGFVNKILKDKSIVIYDLSKFPLPLNIGGLKYTIDDADIVSDGHSLAIRVNVGVHK